MKTPLLFLLLVVGTTLGNAQTQVYDITTRSVEVENLISFVVNTYESGDIDDKNLTFLLQLKEDELSGEDLVMLKQAFKILSERLSEDSQISILTYSGFSGVALEPTNAKEIALILHTITDLKANISEFYSDGINLGYEHAEQNYLEDYLNELIMIRTSKKAENLVVNIEKEEKKAKRKTKRDAILVAALAVLPEIINLIKD